MEQKKRRRANVYCTVILFVTSLCLAVLLGGASDDANAIWMARGLSGSCHKNACHDSGGRMCQPMLLCASTWATFFIKFKSWTHKRDRERGWMGNRKDSDRDGLGTEREREREGVAGLGGHKKTNASTALRSNLTCQT